MSAHTLQLPPIGRQQRPLLVMGALWLLSMISVPILLWTVGDGARVWGLSVTVLLQSALVVTVLAQAWGVRRTALTALTIVALAWLAEFIGVATGLPFGRYHYTELLQPQLGDVPLLISTAWLMMLPPAWGVAARLAGDNRLAFALVSGLAITAWDLYLDPWLVSWGVWQWQVPGAYFGIPLLNFAGWVLVATIMTFVVNPRAVPVTPLLILYGVVWVMQGVGQAVFWGQPGPAAFGFAAMGLLLLLAARWGRERSYAG